MMRRSATLFFIAHAVATAAESLRRYSGWQRWNPFHHSTSHATEATSRDEVRLPEQESLKEHRVFGADYRRVVYKTVGNRSLKLDIYTPRRRGNGDRFFGPGLVPAVVLIHGGGWMIDPRYHEEPGSLGKYGQIVLKNGSAVVSVEYRLVGEHGVPTYWPAQGEDVVDAMGFLRASATEYGIDPHRLGCMGHSSGGHLCSWLATAQGIGQARPDAALAMSPPTCFLCGEGGEFLGAHPADWLFGFEEGTLQSLKSNPDRLRGNATAMLNLVHSAEPLWHAQRYAGEAGQMPSPLYLLHGREDEVVPVAKTLMLKEALASQGLQVHAHLVPHGMHDTNSFTTTAHLAVISLVSTLESLPSFVASRALG